MYTRTLAPRVFVLVAVCCGCAGNEHPEPSQGTDQGTDHGTDHGTGLDTSLDTDHATGPIDQCAELATEPAPSLALASSNPRIFDSDSSIDIIGAPGAFDTEVLLIRNDDLVWRAIASEETASVSLGDGEFVDGVSTTLAEWTKHTVRARAFDGACGRSSWSADLEFRSDDGSDDLFGRSDPLEAALTLSEESYAAIAAEAKPEGQSYPYTRDYYAADIGLEGSEFTHSGARVKGAGTARTLDEKAAFKLHLSWDDPDVPGCGPDRRFNGLKRITLNNMVQDRSYLHETLGYQFYAALGLHVPRTQFANVSLNGEHLGLYLHVETIDRRFLARRFASRKGMLYEAIYGGGRDCDLSPEKLGAAEDVNCFKASFSTDECDGNTEGYDATDYSHLHRLAEQIEQLPPGELYEGLQGFFDIEEYLTLFAAEIVVGAGDSHFYHWNNYRIYHEPTEDMWHTLPSGIDTSFSNWLPPDTVSSEPVVYLAQRCLDEVPCRARLVEIIEGALDTFDSMDFETRMDDLIALIADDVANDARGESTPEQIESSRNSMRSFIQDRRGIVEELLAEWTVGL